MMRILEILLPKGVSDRSLSSRTLCKIKDLQQRMTLYVDKIMDPTTSKAGREFLKSKLRADYNDLRNTLPQAVSEDTQINEIFQSPAEWEWFNCGPSRAVADFKIGDISYEFIANRVNSNDETWAVKFRIVPKDDETESGYGKEYSITGTGNSATVFSTVLDILKNFVREYPEVEKLIFQADEPSRRKLYLHLADRLLPNTEIKRIGNHFTVSLPQTTENKEKQHISEAVTKLPLSDDDFDLVKKVMERPIPAAIAPIYISQIIEDDELNDQLASLEESDPGRDVRPLVAQWFDRVMPDQMHRFTGDVQNYAQKNGVLSLIHGYDSHEYKGENNPITGDAYGFR